MTTPSPADSARHVADEVGELIETAARGVAYSYNFATAKPDIGAVERDHILGLCAMVNQLSDAVRALRQGGEAWQPMDSAPKDGSLIWVTDGISSAAAKWMPAIPETTERWEGGWSWFAEVPARWATASGLRCVEPMNPTHWQPLPTPPGAQP